MIYLWWLILGALLACAYIYGSTRISWISLKANLAVGLVVAAVNYVGFALVWGSTHWVLIESLGIPIYDLMAWLGVKKSPVWLAVGWMLHMPWDLFLHYIGPGFHVAPEWYMFACFSFDLVVGEYVLLWVTGRLPSQNEQKRLGGI